MRDLVRAPVQLSGVNSHRESAFAFTHKKATLPTQIWESIGNCLAMGILDSPLVEGSKHPYKVGQTPMLLEKVKGGKPLL